MWQSSGIAVWGRHLNPFYWLDIFPQQASDILCICSAKCLLAQTLKVSWPFLVVTQIPVGPFGLLIAPLNLLRLPWETEYDCHGTLLLLDRALIKQLHTPLTRGRHTATNFQVIKISSSTHRPLVQERRLVCHVQSRVNWCSLKNGQLAHCNWAPFKLAVHCAPVFVCPHFSTRLAMLLSWTQSAQGTVPFWLRVICNTNLTHNVFTSGLKLSRTCGWKKIKLSL